MKKLLLLCLVTWFCAHTWAQTEKVLCMTVVNNLGEELYFAVDEEPVVTCDDNVMVVEVAGYTIEVGTLDSIETCYFSDEIPTVSGIGSINTIDGDLADFSNGKVIITGLKDGAQVMVYTADGLMVGSVTASEDGNVCVDLNSLKGNQVYILRTPSATYKIAK